MWCLLGKPDTSLMVINMSSDLVTPSFHWVDVLKVVVEVIFVAWKSSFLEIEKGQTMSIACPSIEVLGSETKWIMAMWLYTITRPSLSITSVLWKYWFYMFIILDIHYVWYEMVVELLGFAYRRGNERLRREEGN